MVGIAVYNISKFTPIIEITDEDRKNYWEELKNEIFAEISFW